jgi:hypothetical protein
MGDATTADVACRRAGIKLSVFQPVVPDGKGIGNVRGYLQRAVQAHTVEDEFGYFEYA